MTVAVDHRDAGPSANRGRVAVRVTAVTGIVVAVTSIRVLAYRRSGVDAYAVSFAYASLVPAAYLVPGVVLLLRRDGRVIGWLLCLLALYLGFGFSSAVGVSAVAAGDAWLVWLLDVSEGSLGWLLFAALLVVFPYGLAAQPPRHRRVGVAVLAAAGIATGLKRFASRVSDAGSMSPRTTSASIGRPS